MKDSSFNPPIGGIRVFISSTFLDLPLERKAVVDAIQDLNFAFSSLGITIAPYDLRRGAVAYPPLDVCLRELGHCHIVIMILGFLYGSETHQHISFTEAEYDEATRLSKYRLAYYKNEEVILLPEYKENTLEKRQKLNDFKRKIEAHVKRDSFTTADELRGHVIRDLLYLLLNDDKWASLFATSEERSECQELYNVAFLLKQGRYGDAGKALLKTTPHGEHNTKRFSVLFTMLMKDLLQIGRLTVPTYINNPILRAKLLLRYLEIAPPLSESVALEELQVLDSRISDPEYSVKICKLKIESFIENNHYAPVLTEAIKAIAIARRAKNPHLLSSVYNTVGSYYRAKGNHFKAARYYWKGISELCRVKKICLHCLSDLFLMAGVEHIELSECVLANDRFGKAMYVAMQIPDIKREANAVYSLARHLAHHNELEPAVAAYVYYARLVKSVSPEDERADIGMNLHELALKHGHEKMCEILNSVQGNAGDVLYAYLKPYELDKFVDDLRIRHGTNKMGSWNTMSSFCRLFGHFKGRITKWFEKHAKCSH